MKQSRKKHSPGFKAKVALAALQETKPSLSCPADSKSIPARYTPGKGRCWRVLQGCSALTRSPRKRLGTLRSTSSIGILVS